MISIQYFFCIVGAIVLTVVTAQTNSTNNTTDVTEGSTTNNTTDTEISDIVYDGCNIDEYYTSLDGTFDTWTKEMVQNLIVTTHMNTLPALGESGEENILDALVDLDAAEPDPDTLEARVLLYMRLIPFPAKQQNTPEGWRRGDLWPDNRGTGAITKAFTDVHSKKPTDWEVDTTIGDLFWGTCGTVENVTKCIEPATSDPETADSTAQDRKIKTPPETMRGPVARAVLYTALRYELELGLKLTDCPPFTITDYGYLSELLKWNSMYEPTEDEITRNDRACSRWQGNRNPFIDYPDLATQFYGQPDEILEGTFAYSACTAPTMSPTATPNECSELLPGDISVVIFNSDPDDQIVLFTVSEIPEEVGSIFVTDKAWTGIDFEPNEGILEYVIPEGGISPGKFFAYGIKYEEDKGTWERIDVGSDGTFDLSTVRPDNIHVYCLNADDEPHFISSLTYNGAFDEPGLDTYDASQTSIPAGLETEGSVALPFSPNYLYEGTRAGSRDELVAAFADPANYKGSNIPYEIDLSSAAAVTSSIQRFAILLPLLLVGFML